MAKQIFSGIGRSLKTRELLKHENPEFKAALNEGLKQTIINALGADETLSKTIKHLDLDVEKLKDTSLDKVIEGISDKVDVKYQGIIKDYLTSFEKEKDQPKVSDVLGLDVQLSENPLLSDSILKYNATKIGALISIKNLDTNKELPQLLHTSPDQKTILLQQWKIEKNWTDIEINKLENTIDLMRITDNQADMVEALAKGGVEKTADLIKYNVTTLKTIMFNAKIGSPENAETENYAKQILLDVENEHPTAFFMYRVVEKPEWLGLDKADLPIVSNNFKEFYNKNKTFDLKTEPIISLETGLLNDKIKGIKSDPTLIAELSLAQQALQISPDTDIAALLMAKQVNVYKAVNTTHNSLIRELDIDLDTAIQIKEKAQYFHEMTMNGFLAYRDLYSNPFITNVLGNLNSIRDVIINGIGKDINWENIKQSNGLKDLNSIEDLFGSQNYCECDSCQSVLSPAAYFVDLMRFIEQRVLKTTKGSSGATESILENTHPIHLKVRRPDLWNLKLTCENTNKHIPYIEIVNEVLTTFIEKQTSDNLTVFQRLLQEKPKLEFSLPYNHSLAEVRTWLSYFKIKRIELLEFLYPNPNESEQLSLALERLSLSKEQYEHIINDGLSATIDKDVMEFRQKSNLSPEETEQLVDLGFWNKKLQIKQIKDSSDLQQFKLEFSSSIEKWQGTLHRIIRLWQASGWNLTELDIVLQTFDIQHSNLNQEAILNLGLFKKLQEITGLGVEELSGILVGISHTNSIHKKLSWEHLLPYSWVDNNTIDLDVLKEGIDENAIKLLLQLQGIFGIGAQDTLEALSFLESKLGSPITFSQTNMETLYRYIQLYKWSKSSSFDDFGQTIKIWDNEQDNYLDLSTTHILDLTEFIRSLPFSISDLVYIFSKELNTTEVISENREFLENEEIREFVRSEQFERSRQFELLFNKWLEIDADILSWYKLFLEVDDHIIDNLFDDLLNENPTDETFIGLSNIKNKLERLVFIFDNFKIDTNSQIDIATKYADYNIFKFGFITWQDLKWVKEISFLSKWLSETKALKNLDLIDLLAKIDTPSTWSLNDQRAIAKWQKTTLSQVQSEVTSHDSISSLQTLWERLKWINVLNINSETLDQFKTDHNYELQSELLQNSIRSQFEDNESWENSIQDFKNMLSSQLRDALCSFVIFNNTIRSKNFGFKNRESLYQYFLLDVSMGDCFTLPRIVAATNSLQVYIHRCIMGLERSADEKISVLLDIDEIQEWEWRKNYRVWEANRKIFLFPENYAEAEIRDNKSPEFKELEDELLQQKLNLEVVENAYKKYLDQIMILAELRIAGAYFDKPNDRIYLFGKTNKQPTEFYYRHLEFLDAGGIIWSNWEKIDIAISAEDVSAIVYNGKLHVFWTSSQRKDISSITGGSSEIKQHTYDIFLNYSYLKVNKKWSPPQKVELGYRVNSPYDAFLRINAYKNQIADNKFKNEAESSGIRENVLKEFEQTVQRKPYPLYANDKKELKFGFIWTDKQNALEPRYKKTNAIIDNFNVSVKLKIDLIVFNVEQNVEFKFDRIDRVVHTASSPNQQNAPSSISITPFLFTFHYYGETLNFKMEITKQGSGNYRYSLKTQSNSGNQVIFFKETNKEVKSGDVQILSQIDYVPVSEIKYVSNYVNMANQKASKTNSSMVSTTLEREYYSYYDNFTDFFITDGTTSFANGSSTCKIHQKDLVSVLTTSSKSNPNSGYNLNPGQIQMLWDKISLGLEALLDTQSSQRHVANQIDYGQSFGNYFFELFFHIPMRIADHLNAAGKYKEANYWYGFIYNPTAIKDKFEQLAFPHDVNWRFAAFRNVGLQSLKEIYSNPNAIEMYKRNPGNPHAIARLRIGAYQKHVVMKYLDNLLDWADNLFEQFTPESTSEARHLYSVVKTILGNKPQSTGKCKGTKELTYNKIKNSGANEFIYNLFTATTTGYGKINEKSTLKKDKNNESITYSVSGRILSQNTDTKYKSKQSVVNSNQHLVQARTAAKAKIGMSKATNLREITSDSRFTSTKANRDVFVPHHATPLFNFENDLVFCFPNNRDFINYWDRVNDRIYKLNHCLDINGVKKQMPAYAPEIDPMLLARMVGDGLSFDEILGVLNNRLPNHRFIYLIEKAKQYAGIVQSFGQSLFSAIEKKDAEELTVLRTRHEQNILTLTTQVKKQQIEQAKTSLKVLEENKKGIEIRKNHYEQLINEGLISWEIAEQSAKLMAAGLRTAESVFQIYASVTALVPQVGSPFAMKYGGVELSGSSAKFAGSLDALAKIADNVAVMTGMEGSHQRRKQDWQFQVLNTAQDLVSINEQIRNAEIAVQIAEYDLEIHQTNIEQYKELYEFYTTKFSGLGHYTFQVRQLQQLYRMAFNLAQDMALQTQKAFEFERYGLDAPPVFIKNDNWNNEKLGLLAGEQLNLQLMQLEQEFINTDKRKLEITQHFSVLQWAPEKLLELKINGECSNFSIPEAAFDLIYPGYYRRIIKSVRVSIPCVAGPYTNIGATLTLGTNKIRTKTNEDLEDFNFSGCATIATSTAQNDGGQFELNFKDEKYLPFEGAGAVSSWTLSLPKTIRPFDYNTISDVIFHISYTAEYDGVFKDRVEMELATALNTLNGTGMFRTFSLRLDFPMEWNLLQDSNNLNDLVLELRPKHFPFFANISDIDSIGTKAYTLDSNNKWNEEPNNLGISKDRSMKIKIPATVGKSGFKDVLFLVKYKYH